ncbi:MAG TPA: type II secretion system minor pseudopilin GspI [Burkholderiales bacterium]
MAGSAPRLRSRRPPDGAASSIAAGFTLVEVLVALAVLAIALAAVLRTVGQSIDLTIGLRDRTEALWAAEERATEILLRREWPGLQTTEGTMSFAEREWRWRQRVSATPLADLRRVDIEITAPRSSQVLGRITLFVARP